MEIPNKTKAVVTESKIKDYLLSDSHVIGKTKAEYFKSVGYSLKKWRILQRDLLSIATNYRVTNRVDTGFGEKYVIDGIIETPSEREVNIRTVWIIETDKNNPYLITAYPR